ncbi:unnamed protein product [Symbiodinium sp. CCMP2592]|nr:unnamed protein product [Symbiodinium sp. CCMP2592]
MLPADGPAPDTTVAVVRDYSVRTFSRADAAEPREPALIRATCCNRLAGPALDFIELPDARMHWAPLPRRGTHGIEAWHPQWLCMRCHNELPFESVRIPSPTATCPVCVTPMLWEVDVARHHERWVCSRCPFAHAARPFAPACHAPDVANQQPANPPAQGDEHGAAPAPAPALFQYTTSGPPPLPLREGTNSALYVPLLLDAAGLLTAQAGHRRSSPGAHALPSASGGLPMPAAVEALRARPFIPVDELTQAFEHVALAFAPPVLQSPSVQRFRVWAGARAGQVASLSDVLRAIAVAPEGHYTLRARPPDAPDPPPQIHPGASADAAAPAALRQRSDVTPPPPTAPTWRADPQVVTEPAVCPAVPNPQGALPDPLAGSAPPGVVHPAEPAHEHGDPDAARAANTDTSLARLAAQAASRSRAGGRGRRGGRGRGRGRRLVENEGPAPAPEADAAADGPTLNREGTAAQRRVAAAEDGMRLGLAALDDVCLEDIFRCRTLTLQAVPARLRGALRTAMRTGLELVSERTSPQQELRGWKLFLLAPRMLLHRAAGQTRIPPAELALRCEAFARGEWLTLLHAAARTAEAPHLAAARSAAQDVEARAHRAAALVHLGELSAAGRALTAEPLAPATNATLAELRDPMRRPPEPYGATNEHLRILLDDEVDSQLLHCAAQRLAQADVPAAALAALRVGRIVALQKPDGRGIRALVIGDVLRLSEWLPPARDGRPVWVGDPALPPDQRGIHVLGTLIGHDTFQKAALLAKQCQHDSLLDKLPGELLGSDGPLHFDDQALQRAMLPLRLGGLGLRSAVAGRCAAYWASLADTLPTLQNRAPELVAAAYHPAGSAGAVPATSSVAELLQATTRLSEAGYAAPGWGVLSAGGEPPWEPAERDRGW